MVMTGKTTDWLESARSRAGEWCSGQWASWRWRSSVNESSFLVHAPQRPGQLRNRQALSKRPVRIEYTTNAGSVTALLGCDGLDVAALQSELGTSAGHRLGLITSRFAIPTCIACLGSYLASAALIKGARAWEGRGFRCLR